MSSGASDVADSLDEATGSAKKLKQMLLGIDELNVMPDSNSGSGGSSSSGAGDFGFELPTYDFMTEINSNVDEAYKKLKKILKPLRKIMDMLVEYKNLILLGLGITAIVKLWGKLKLLWAWFTGLKLVSVFTSSFAFLREAGAGFFQSLGLGFEVVRNNLTGMQKAAIVAVAGFLEFDKVRDNVKELALGCDDVGNKIAGIAVVVAGAAAAMYVALGPAGLAVAAIVGLTGFIVGMNDAQKEMMNAMTNEVFYSGVGTNIGELADVYDRLTGSIISTYQPIIDNQSKIDELRGSVSETTDSIDGIARALAIGSAVASEEIEEIRALFDQLGTDTETIMDDIYNNIVAAIGGSFGEALLKAGESIPEVMEILQQIRGEGVDTLTSLRTELDNLSDQLEAGEITQEEFGTRWVEIEKQMNSLIGVTDEYTEVFGTLRDAIGNISWGDEDQKNDFFSHVVSSSDEAKKAINDASDSIIENLEAMKNWTTDDNLKAKIDEWITIAESDRQRQLNNVDDQLTLLYDAVQQDMILKAAKMKEEAVKQWNDMNWFQKMWNGGSEEVYVRKALGNYQKNIISPVTTQINDSFNEMGIEASGWANDTMSDVLDALFSSEFVRNPRGSGGTRVYEYQDSIENAIKSALSNAAGGAKQTAVDVGSGIIGDIGTGLSVTDALSDAVDDVFANSLSPDVAYGYGSEFGNKLGSGIAQGLKTTKYPTISTQVATKSGGSTMTFTAYASGGFPTVGEMFVAREAGPELVGSIGNRSAVVNNDQIVESVSRGVYEAVAAAMDGYTGGQSDQAINIYLDGKQITATVEKHQKSRGATLMTGGMAYGY